jgi:NADH:ubiquinone oxidoreductase subunit E
MNETHTEPIPNPLQRQDAFALSPALEAEIDELITHYPVRRSASLMVLHAIQERRSSPWSRSTSTSW